MPANRTVASLTIALIVFVMLTFVLAITTYLFFKQRIDEEVKTVAAVAETNKARTELAAAIEEKRKIQEILGIPDEKTVAQIEAETNARFTGEFVGFDTEPKTYLTLIEWLVKSIREKDEQMAAQKLDHEKQIVEKDQAIEAEKTTVARTITDRDAIVADAKSEKEKFDASRGEHESQQKTLAETRDKALEESTAFDKLKAEVAKGVQYLGPEQQKDFQARQDPEGQLEVLYRALRTGRAEIVRQNDILATLRAADPAVQAAVNNANPKDDRIDGFDGRVISVDPAERTVLISCRTTRGLRPGLMLSVFDPADPRPQVGNQKGLLEVVAVEGPTVARARIRRDSFRDPILGGDGVATSFWAPGESPEVVILGFVQLDTDDPPDTDFLKSVLERAGARVVDSVTPNTALVVDGGLPKKKVAAEGEAEGDAEGEAGKVPGWRASDVKRRDRETKNARNLGIRIVGLEEMLKLLGLERTDIETGRLPTRGDDRRSLPSRAAGVAY